MLNNKNPNFVLKNLLDRFNEMLVKGIDQYFEVNELNEIINYFIDKEEIEKAKKAIDLGLKLHGESYEINLLNLKYQIAKQNLVGAKRLIHKLLITQPQDGELFLYSAIVLIYENKFQEAKKLIRKGIRFSDFGQTDYLYVPIAYVFISMKQYLDGALYLKKYYENYEDTDDLLLDIARAYEKAGKYKLAKSYYNKYLDRSPFSAIAWFELGQLQSLHEGMLSESCLDSFEFALSLRPDFKEVYLAKGDYYYKNSAFDFSLECYRDYEKIDACGLIFYRMARSLSGRNNFSLSERYYKMATDKGYDLLDFNYDRALNLYRKKDYNEAYDLVIKVIEKDDFQAKYWYLAALISGALGNIETAGKFFDEALKLDDQNSEYWVAFADMYYKNKNFSRALEILSSAILKHVTNYKIMYRLCVFAIILKRDREAQHFLKLAIEDNPIKTLSELLIYYPQAESIDYLKKILSKIENEY